MMIDLKMLLFEQTKQYRLLWRRNVHTFGLFDSAASSCERTFRALFDLIKEAGLEEEYLTWVEGASDGTD